MFSLFTKKKPLDFSKCIERIFIFFNFFSFANIHNLTTKSKNEGNQPHAQRNVDFPREYSAR